jgi:hypothetical protein
MRVLCLLAIAGVGGCTPFSGGAFTCEDNANCDQSPGGVCEPNGFCSFPDLMCPSGRRYGEASGTNSGLCVGDEPDPIDSSLACPFGGIDPCATGAADGALTFGSETIDTGSDPRCRTLTQAGGPPACLIFAESVMVPGGAIVTAIGNRPLVIASLGSIVVGGTIDAGSGAGRIGAGADGAGCTVGREAEADDSGGAGGAAGGSYGAIGGDGGIGDTNNSGGSDGTAINGAAGSAFALPAFARGGCPGAVGGNDILTASAGGGGGAPGGAVWLLAMGEIQIETMGVVAANGAGGGGGAMQAGGGGGGSGGWIKIDAPTITIAGNVAANGGGGGEGGCCQGAAPPGMPGNPGIDGAIGMTGGAGGAGGNAAGDGGAGGGTTPGGSVGGDSGAAAGGGGGSSGFVVIVGTPAITGTVSPPQ